MLLTLADTTPLAEHMPKSTASTYSQIYRFLPGRPSYHNVKESGISTTTETQHLVTSTYRKKKQRPFRASAIISYKCASLPKKPSPALTCKNRPLGPKRLNRASNCWGRFSPTYTWSLSGWVAVATPAHFSCLSKEGTYRDTGL